HDLLTYAVGPFVGIRRQCVTDAERGMAQGPRRCDLALHDGGCRVLWPDHLRGILYGDPLRQFALPLHGLDHRTCPCRGARLGRDDHFWFDLFARALAMEAEGYVFRGPRGG